MPSRPSPTSGSPDDAARAPGWSAAASASLVVLAVGGVTGAAAPTGPNQHPTPTSEDAAASVRIFDPAGSVTVWNPAGSVSALSTTSTSGAQTVITLKSDILFGFASASLRPGAAARIGQLVADVPRSARVAVTGYTDAIGNDAANRVLSRERAEAVAAAATARRADLVLDVAGRGEAEPEAPNTVAGQDNPDGRARNRRVEIRYPGDPCPG
jgi:OmpA-OmpF porin, OOP family